jgi:hypothetical protein
VAGVLLAAAAQPHSARVARAMAMTLCLMMGSVITPNSSMTPSLRRHREGNRESTPHLPCKWCSLRSPEATVACPTSVVGSSQMTVVGHRSVLPHMTALGKGVSGNSASSTQSGYMSLGCEKHRIHLQ